MVVVVRMVGWSQFMCVEPVLWSLITPILLEPPMSNKIRQLLYNKHHYYVILTNQVAFVHIARNKYIRYLYLARSLGMNIFGKLSRYEYIHCSYPE